jgi:hypothetical protein
MSDEQQTPAPTGLTVQDLTLTLQVIQVASTRGAFKADELTAIGGLYDRIFKFLEASGAITTKPAEEPPAASETSPAASVKAPAMKAAAKKKA